VPNAVNEITPDLAGFVSLRILACGILQIPVLYKIHVNEHSAIAAQQTVLP
jgi:hypothetical protein